MSNAKVWYRFNGQPKASANLVRNGKDLLFKSRFFMDQAVIHCTWEGIKSNSSRNRLPKSGMCPPPYNMAILLWPSSIALLRASSAALFLSPIMTDPSSTSAVTCVNLHRYPLQSIHKSTDILTNAGRLNFMGLRKWTRLKNRLSSYSDVSRFARKTFIAAPKSSLDKASISGYSDV